MDTQRDFGFDAALPPQTLFDALLQHVQGGKYKIVALGNETRQMVFTKGQGLVSPPRTYMAVVEETDGGSSLKVSLDTTNKGGLLDGKVNERHALKFLDAVKSVLTSDTPPSPEPVSSFRELPDGSTVPWTSGTLEELAENPG